MDIFIDDIDKLHQNYTLPTGSVFILTKIGSVEGTSMFKRNNTGYVLVGPRCCCCKGGNHTFIFTSNNPMRPCIFKGDIESKGYVFNPYSPHTHAQGSDVIVVETPSQ